MTVHGSWTLDRLVEVYTQHQHRAVVRQSALHRALRPSNRSSPRSGSSNASPRALRLTSTRRRKWQRGCSTGEPEMPIGGGGSTIYLSAPRRERGGFFPTPTAGGVQAAWWRRQPPAQPSRRS